MMPMKIEPPFLLRLADREVHRKGRCRPCAGPYLAADADDLLLAGRAGSWRDSRRARSRYGSRHQHLDVLADHLVGA